MEGARAWGVQGVTAQWVWVSVWVDEKVQEIDDMLVTQYCECFRCHQIVHFKMVKLVNFMLSLFYYHNKKSKNPDVWPAPLGCSLLAPVKSSVDTGTSPQKAHLRRMHVDMQKKTALPVVAESSQSTQPLPSLKSGAFTCNGIGCRWLLLRK